MTWIKVKEKLPKVNESVLVTSFFNGFEWDKTVVVAFMNKNNEFKVDTDGIHSDATIDLSIDVTHWMNIPEFGE